MVCKEDICEWFRESVSSQRLDLMSTLLQLCLPLEIRFVGSCLEERARRDYGRLRENELKANELSVYGELFAEASLPSAVYKLPKKLTIYVALMRSNNSSCASRFYELLLLLWNHVRNSAQLIDSARGLATISPAQVSTAENAQIQIDGQSSADLLLLFTMACYHPAFAFSQRMKLYHIMDSLRQLLVPISFNGQQLKDNNHQQSQESTNDEENLSTGVANEYVANGIDSISDSVHSSVKEPIFYPVDVDLGVKPGKQHNVYRFTTKFSNGSTAEVCKTFQQLREFYEEVVSQYDQVLGKSCQLPRFPIDKLPAFSNQRHSAEVIRKCFRELLKLPYQLHREAVTVTRFCEFVGVADNAAMLLKPASVPPFLSETASHLSSSQSADSLANITKMPSEWPSRTSGGLSTAAPSINSMQSSRSPEPNTGAGVVLSKSSPMLTTHRGSSGSRSRHNSPQGCSNIELWLKTTRLHKYADCLSKYTVDELKHLNLTDLQKLGLTSGACKKFLNSISELSSSSSSRNEEMLDESSSQSSDRIAPVEFSRSPVVRSPITVDSSCSEYSTPPGSPPIDKFNSVVTRSVNHGRDQDSLTWSTGSSTTALELSQSSDSTLETSSASISANNQQLMTGLDNETLLQQTIGVSTIPQDVVVSNIQQQTVGLDNQPQQPQVAGLDWSRPGQAAVPDAALPADMYPLAPGQFTQFVAAANPIPGYYAVRPPTGFEAYSLAVHPVEYPAVASNAIPASQTVSLPEISVPSPVSLVSPYSPLPQPPQMMPPRDAVLVRPRHEFPLSGHPTPRSGYVILPPPPNLNAEQSAMPPPSYISVDTNHFNATVAAVGASVGEVYGSRAIVSPEMASVPRPSGDEDSNSVALNAVPPNPVPRLPVCQQCGQPVATAGPATLVPNMFIPHPTWQSTYVPFLPVQMVSGPYCLPPGVTTATPPPPVPFRPEMVFQIFPPPPHPGGQVIASYKDQISVFQGMAGLRLGAIRPLLHCSNCGAYGHSYDACTESSVDTVLNPVGQFCLDINPNNVEPD